MIKHLEACAKYEFDAAMVPPCMCHWQRIFKGNRNKSSNYSKFPMANDTLDMKIAALKELAKIRPDEFDFPPNPGLLIGGYEKEYLEEMVQIVKVSHDSGIVVKAMLEFGFLNEEQKAKAAQLAYEAGIDWVKQSSGWGVGGCAATVEDVKILKENIQAPCRVKVSGKVNTLEKMKAMFEAGAELVGTSSGPEIMEGLEGDIDAY